MTRPAWFKEAEAAGLVDAWEDLTSDSSVGTQGVRRWMWLGAQRKAYLDVPGWSGNAKSAPGEEVATMRALLAAVLAFDSAMSQQPSGDTGKGD